LQDGGIEQFYVNNVGDLYLKNINSLTNTNIAINNNLLLNYYNTNISNSGVYATAVLINKQYNIITVTNSLSGCVLKKITSIGEQFHIYNFGNGILKIYCDNLDTIQNSVSIQLQPF
jgi:hypothetical protein